MSSSPGMLTLLANEVVDDDHEFVAPSPARQRRTDLLPLERLVKDGLVGVGDTLTFRDKEAVVMRDGWLEVGRDTLTLEAFVTKVAGKAVLGKDTYATIHVNDGKTLWELSEQLQGRSSTTLKVEASDADADSAPLSFQADDVQELISTQLPDEEQEEDEEEEYVQVVDEDEEAEAEKNRLGSPTTPKTPTKRPRAADSSSEQLVIVIDESSSSQEKRPRHLSFSPVLLASGLDSRAIAELVQQARLRGGRVVSEWAEDVTHVVIEARQEGHHCKRTLKYMMGVLGGALVVSPEWVEQSKRAGKWLDEAPFLVGDRHGREAAVGRWTGPPLFHDHCFLILPEGAPLAVEELAGLIRAGGGQVVEEAPTDDTSVFMVLCHDAITEEQSHEVFRRTGRDPVFFKWLFDCVSNRERIHLRHNATYKRTFDQDAGIVFQTQNSPEL